MRDYCAEAIAGTIYGMQKTTVYLDSEVAVALRNLAETSKRPQAELIREALTEYTQRAKRALPPGAGKYRSGRKDLSEKAEEILAEAARTRAWH
jgi:hypothetical protein